MPCNFCYPDSYDYGYDLPDQRASMTVSDDYKRAVVEVRRRPVTCEDCNQGHDYKVSFVAVMPDGREMVCHSQDEGIAIIRACYPDWKDYEYIDIEAREERRIALAEMAYMGGY